MPSQKSIPISELITTANSELLRLDFKRSALQIYCAEFRKFSDYYSNEKIQDYTATTGREYFQSIYGVNIASPRLQLTKSQSATRRAIRLLDDIFQFGYALRYCHRSYTVNPEYDILLESYLMKCRKKHNSQGTLRTKQMKLCQFFEYIEGRNIQLACLTSADLSNFMTTLCRCRRPTLYTTASVLKDFLRYLYESEQFTKDLSADVPKPKIYTDEDIPETWTPAEVKQLLSAVDRSNPIGKRDYAMFLLAILLGMRAGDICNLRFKNLDWNQKLITYTQQKSGKVSALPLLPVIGEAIIDYLRNGRLDSNCDNVFIRHLHPYGGFQSSAAVSSALKKYITYAGLTRKNRKAIHSLRRTLASTLLMDGTPLLTISNMVEEPQFMEQCIQIHNIPKMVSSAPPAKYLTPDALRCLLATPDITTPKGRRHLVLLTVLYDTAARVSELADIRMRDVRLDSPAAITLHGKVGKVRTVPLMKQTVELLQSYFTENGITPQKSPDMPLFWSGNYRKLTRSGITYIVQKYAAAAQAISTDIPATISPHVFRHTKAMHLVQANVNTVYIKDYLGHADISTTELYARADNEAKHAALEKASLCLELPCASNWEQDADLIAWLSSLG